MIKGSILTIENLTVRTGSIEILKDINMTLQPGEVHVVMGPNGSGKSTLLYALMGHPAYSVHSNSTLKVHSISLDSEEISNLSTEERAKKGLFLALQSPMPIPGVTVTQILRSAIASRDTKTIRGSKSARRSFNPILPKDTLIGGISLLDFAKSIQSEALSLGISKDLLGRGIHDGFSGGERKKIEILEALILKPKVALFDEIDTGLDVDALRTVASGILRLKKMGTTILIVTHYQRILQYIVPDKVHVLAHGRLIASGDMKLAKEIDRKGYAQYATTITN